MEVFICGTAVVIRPVGSIMYKGEELRPQFPEGQLSVELYKKLQDIQVLFKATRSSDESSTPSPTWLTNPHHTLSQAAL